MDLGWYPYHREPPMPGAILADSYISSTGLAWCQFTTQNRVWQKLFPKQGRNSKGKVPDITPKVKEAFPLP
jgi:hypothetical protein